MYKCLKQMVSRPGLVPKLRDWNPLIQSLKLGKAYWPETSFSRNFELFILFANRSASNADFLLAYSF